MWVVPLPGVLDDLWDIDQEGLDDESPHFEVEEVHQGKVPEQSQVEFHIEHGQPLLDLSRSYLDVHVSGSPHSEDHSHIKEDTLQHQQKYGQDKVHIVLR